MYEQEKLQTRIFMVVKHADWKFSENYRKGLVFGLLGALKAGAKDKFLWEIERVINSRNISSSESDAILRSLINSEGDEFKSRSYAVVAGILAWQPTNES